MRVLVPALAILLVTACTTKPRSQQGGHVQTALGTEAPSAVLVAPENPKTGSTVTLTRKVTREYAQPSPLEVPIAPELRLETIEETSVAEVGSSWEQRLDKALAAVARAKIITWAGVGLLLAGAFVAVKGWPIVGAIGGGVGIALIYDQNWLWLLGLLACGAVAFTYFKSRYDAEQERKNESPPKT